MIVPPILPLGTVVGEMKNEPHHCHQPLHSVDDRPFLWVRPQLHEKTPLFRYCLGFALQPHLRTVAEFRVGAL